MKIHVAPEATSYSKTKAGLNILSVDVSREKQSKRSHWCSVTSNACWSHYVPATRTLHSCLVSGVASQSVVAWSVNIAPILGKLLSTSSSSVWLVWQTELLIWIFIWVLQRCRRFAATCVPGFQCYFHFAQASEKRHLETIIWGIGWRTSQLWKPSCFSWSVCNLSFINEFCESIN